METTTSSDALIDADPLDPARPETWLTSDDPIRRLTAVGMHATPGAITVDNLDAFLGCLDRCRDELDTLTVGAFILGALEPPLCCDATDQRMVGFLGRLDKSPLRLAAAHGLFRQKRLPNSAHLPLAQMLFHSEENIRQMAQLTFSLEPEAAAKTIAQTVAGMPREQWTPEALTTLVQSAGDSPIGRQQIGAFLRAELAKGANRPAVIAALAELARADSFVQPLLDLCSFCSNPALHADHPTALAALGGLGPVAKPAVPELINQLSQTTDPAKETLICKTLCKIGMDTEQLPLARVKDRIEHGPEIVIAPFCAMLALYPVAAKVVAPALKLRFVNASESVRGVLAFSYRALTGEILS